MFDLLVCDKKNVKSNPMLQGYDRWMKPLFVTCMFTPAVKIEIHRLHIGQKWSEVNGRYILKNRYDYYMFIIFIIRQFVCLFCFLQLLLFCSYSFSFIKYYLVFIISQSDFIAFLSQFFQC